MMPECYESTTEMSKYALSRIIPGVLLNQKRSANSFSLRPKCSERKAWEKGRRLFEGRERQSSAARKLAKRRNETQDEEASLGAQKLSPHVTAPRLVNTISRRI